MILCTDFETTGVGELCGLVEIGATWLRNDGLRRSEFFRECRPAGGILVEPGALQVNGYSLERIFDPARMSEMQAVIEFIGFIRGGMADDTKIQIAAWNSPFEMRHLRAALLRAGVSDPFWPFRHSAIDPQAILTADIIRGHRSAAVEVPGVEWPVIEPHEWGGLVKNSDHAAELLGIDPEPRPHKAINGARQVKAMLHALGLKEAA